MVVGLAAAAVGLALTARTLSLTTVGAMSPSTAAPQLVVTSGTFSIDGEDFDVDNNIWIVGNDEECLIVDAAHEAGPIVDAVGGRRVVAMVCTHGHNDHINAAVDVADATGAPIALHPDDLMLWDDVYPGRAPDLLIEDGARFDVGGTTLVALHTPGHSPGGVSLHDADADAVYGGDTLFKGGPGATGRSLLGLPDDHRVDPHEAAHAAGRHRRATPATATRRRSATKPPSSTSGSPAATSGAGAMG